MELLLIIVIVQLGLVLSRLPKKSKSSKEGTFERIEREQKENSVRIASQLAELHGRTCSFVLWLPGQVFAEAGLPTTQGCGVVVDSDDTWVMVECPAPMGAKGATQRVFRISDIKSIAEIVG